MTRPNPSALVTETLARHLPSDAGGSFRMPALSMPPAGLATGLLQSGTVQNTDPRTQQLTYQGPAGSRRYDLFV